MKISITDEEMRNIVAGQTLEDIKLNSNGEFKKWDIQRVEDGYTLEYIFDENGNYKLEFVPEEKAQ